MSYQNPLDLLNAAAEQHKNNGAGQMLKTIQRCVNLINKSGGQLDAKNTKIAVDALHFKINRINFEMNLNYD